MNFYIFRKHLNTKCNKRLLKFLDTTATTLKTAVSWCVKPRNLVDTDRRFIRSYRLHHQHNVYRKRCCAWWTDRRGEANRDADCSGMCRNCVWILQHTCRFTQLDRYTATGLQDPWRHRREAPLSSEQRRTIMHCPQYAATPSTLV